VSEPGVAGRRALTDAERRDWLRLIRSERVGPITFFQLLKRFGSAAAALEALPELAQRGGRTRLKICDVAAADRELDRLAALGARFIGRFEPDYPEALAAVEDAPPLLSVRGRADLLQRRVVGIVGARNASANGVRLARQLAADLGATGFVVASGLARGIDAAAHRGALASGTVAVMAGGVDTIYPPENTGLFEEIVAQGAVVSEMPPGLEPQARHFPQRNRIVSGLSLGVVVVEAALKSGSLITARLALEQGRDVFAVPGSPLDPRARGSNDLLRRGAILTESAEDVLQELGQTQATPVKSLIENESKPAAPAPVDVDSALPKVLEKLGPTPTQVDEIVRQCQLPTAVVHMAILELELAGRLVRHPGNMVSTS
jgi:DNA processing protein